MVNGHDMLKAAARLRSAVALTTPAEWSCGPDHEHDTQTLSQALPQEVSEAVTQVSLMTLIMTLILILITSHMPRATKLSVYTPP